MQIIREKQGTQAGLILLLGAQVTGDGGRLDRLILARSFFFSSGGPDSFVFLAYAGTFRLLD